VTGEIVRRTRLIRLGAGLAAVLIVVPAATGQIRLSLEPAQISVSAGGSFELTLWARADSDETFDGADVVIRWDETAVTLVGHTDDQSSYTWAMSGFLPGSSLNDSLADGDAIYTCASGFAAASPQTDALLTTFQFTAAQTSTVTNVTIPAEADTVVAQNGQNVLTSTTGAAVTIGSGSGGGGGGTGGGGDAGGGTNGNDNGSDTPTGDGGGDSGNDNSGNVDDTATGTGDGGGTNGNDNASDTPTDDDGGDPGNDNSGNAGDTDTATGGGGGHARAGGGAPLCGPWAMQALVACTMCLCAVRVARRSQG
jgi:hypothetical protein